MADRALGNPLGNSLGLARTARHSSTASVGSIVYSPTEPMPNYTKGGVLRQDEYPELFKVVGIKKAPGGIIEWKATTPVGLSYISKVASGKDGVIIAGTNNKNILRSVDGGVTWSTISTPLSASTVTIYGIAGSLSDGKWFIPCYDGATKLLSSTDNGLTWSIVTPSGDPMSIYPEAITTNSDGVWIMAGGLSYGRYMRSVNNGVSWVSSDGMGGSSGFDFVSYDRGTWVMGGSPSLYVSRNNGATFNRPTINGFGLSFSSVSDKKGNWVSINIVSSGDNCAVLISDDDADTWTPLLTGRTGITGFSNTFAPVGLATDGDGTWFAIASHGTITGFTNKDTKASVFEKVSVPSQSVNQVMFHNGEFLLFGGTTLYRGVVKNRYDENVFFYVPEIESTNSAFIKAR